MTRKEFREELDWFFRNIEIDDEKIDELERFLADHLLLTPRKYILLDGDPIAYSYEWAEDETI
jgi:hypothetical protein